MAGAWVAVYTYLLVVIRPMKPTLLQVHICERQRGALVLVKKEGFCRNLMAVRVQVDTPELRFQARDFPYRPGCKQE